MEVPTTGRIGWRRKGLSRLSSVTLLGSCVIKIDTYSCTKKSQTLYKKEPPHRNGPPAIRPMASPFYPRSTQTGRLDT
jgi:hypothetical protein